MSRQKCLSLAAWLIVLATASASHGDASLQDTNTAVTKWLASVGGRAALSSVRSMEIGEVIESSNSSSPSSERTVIREPNMIRVDAPISGGRTLVYSTDGKVGWREVSELGFALLSPAEVGELYLSRDPVYLAKQLDIYSSCEALPAVMRDGTRCDAFHMRDRNGAQERWYFDDSTGFLVIIEAGAASNPVTLRFSDYRRVGPLFIPFEFRFITGGRTAITIHRTSIALNVDLTESYFSAMQWDITDAQRANAILDKYLGTCANPGVAEKRRSRIVHETVETPASGISSTSLVEFEYPNRILVDTETKGIGRDVSGFDGKTGWENSELQGYHVLKPMEISALYRVLGVLGDTKIEQEAQLRRVVGEKIIAGRSTTALFLSSLSEAIGTFYFDNENGHLLQFSSQKRTSGGNRPAATLELSDFRKVDGEDIPFEIIETNTVLQVVTKIQSLENNAPIDEKVFAPRPED